MKPAQIAAILLTISGVGLIIYGLAKGSGTSSAPPASPSLPDVVPGDGGGKSTTTTGTSGAYGAAQIAADLAAKARTLVTGEQRNAAPTDTGNGAVNPR